MEVSAPSVSPAASRRCVARERARKAQSSSIASPSAFGSSEPGAAAPTSFSSRRCM